MCLVGAAQSGESESESESKMKVYRRELHGPAVTVIAMKWGELANWEQLRGETSEEMIANYEADRKAGLI